MSEFKSAEVWGEPVESLPVRPIKPHELQELAEKESVADVRIPQAGQKLLDDDKPGPVITGRNGEISEFIVITESGTLTQLRYGWPEVTSGELAVPQSADQGIQQGYVKWWKETITTFDSVQVKDGDVEISGPMWEIFGANTVSLEDVEQE